MKQRHSSVTAVVWVPSEDCKCAIELFGEHDRGPARAARSWAQGEQQVGACRVLLRPSIGGADGEVQMLRAGVALAPDPRGELLGGHGASAASSRMSFAGTRPDCGSDLV